MEKMYKINIFFLIKFHRLHHVFNKTSRICEKTDVLKEFTLVMTQKKRTKIINVEEAEMVLALKRNPY